MSHIVSNQIKIGIVGGGGYTAGELLRILTHHPNAQIVGVQSQSQASKLLSDTHAGLWDLEPMRFVSELDFSVIDLLFICGGHGESKQFVDSHPAVKSLKIIDLSQDFRDQSAGFVYGLPELNFDVLSQANYIANPGCFATAIQLALLPLAAAHTLTEPVHISAITGSSGAGQAMSPTSHFSWRLSNSSVYKAFEHQHLKEIRQSLSQLQPNFQAPIYFVPYRGDFARGIIASVYTHFEGSIEQARELYASYYQKSAFVRLSDKNPDLKMVVNTNYNVLYLEKYHNQLLIISLIDNLLKGASGQAVENMNIVYGLNPKTGLGLKAIAF